LIVQRLLGILTISKKEGCPRGYLFLAEHFSSGTLGFTTYGQYIKLRASSHSGRGYFSVGAERIRCVHAVAGSYGTGIEGSVYARAMAVRRSG